MHLLSRKSASILLAATIIGRLTTAGQSDQQTTELNLKPGNLDCNQVTQVVNQMPGETNIFELTNSPDLNTYFFSKALSTNSALRAEAAFPIKSSAQTSKTSETINAESSQLIENARTGVLKFINDNFLSLLALGTAGVLAFRRIFPNEWDIENVSLVKLNDKSESPAICTTTLANKHLSEVYGLDFPAFLNFHYALFRTRKNHHLPIVIFKDLPVNRIFSDSPVMELLKKGRSHASAALLGQNHGENLDKHARARFNNAPPAASEYLMVFTYENHGVVKPRAFMIATHDVINLMCDLRKWWEASQDSSEGCRRRLVRNIEMAVCFLLRYPGVFKSKFHGEEKLKCAQDTAKDLFRMLALSPQESEKFINDYLDSNQPRKELTKASQAEKSRIFKTWYGTSDCAKWHQFAVLEKSLSSFNNYLSFCTQNRIPPWFVNVLKTCED